MRYIQDPKTLKLVPYHEYFANIGPVSAPYVQADLLGFQSIATADRPWIEGRKQMREYCKTHGLLPAEEVKGLPTMPMHQEYKRDKVGIKKLLNEIIG